MPCPTSRSPLTIRDPIHGTTTLSPSSTDDSFLLDLIASPAFERLKRVHQHGISTVCGHISLPKGKAPVNRWDHSVGAMLLVRNLGAGIEEQAAALLHDVAHTSLSHVVDSVFNRVVHEEDKDEYLSWTNLPEIVKAHGYEPHRIFEEQNFSLLERDAPRLCADRLDYALRDGLQFGQLTLEETRFILSEMVDNDGEICCRSIEAATILTNAYHRCDKMAWANPSHSGLYFYAAEAIRKAFDKSQFTLRDLWSTSDEDFWALLTDSPHACVRDLAANVRPTLRATPVAVEGLPPSSSSSSSTSSTTPSTPPPSSTLEITVLPTPPSSAPTSPHKKPRLDLPSLPTSSDDPNLPSTPLQTPIVLIEMKTKVRILDPTVWVPSSRGASSSSSSGTGGGDIDDEAEGVWKPLSEVDGELKAFIEERRKMNGKRWFLIDDEPVSESKERA